jgi:cobalt/nickel transport system permease protein
MHIVDGVLSAPVLIGGSLLAVAGVAKGLRELDTEAIPRAGLLTAVFFIASLIHVPIGPASAHLMLTGLMGLLLGWAAFPAILVGLLLQAAFFGFGGLTVIGSNTLSLAFPAVLIGMLARHLLGRVSLPPRSVGVLLAGFLVGALSFGASAILVAGSLALSGSAFLVAAQLILIAQVPVMLIEGAVTAAALRLLMTVRPELIPGTVPVERLASVERPQEA